MRRWTTSRLSRMTLLFTVLGKVREAELFERDSLEILNNCTAPFHNVKMFDLKSPLFFHYAI